MRRLPWYSFLYRFLGAQGTFWLWLLAPLALWWTWEPAVIRLENRKPRPAMIATTEEAPNLRWVTMRGLRLEVDRRLLLQDAPPNLPPVALLIDESDPAASWWLETLALSRAAASNHAIANQGGVLNTLPGLARRRLIRRFARLRGDPRRFLPTPERAVLLQERGASPLSAAPPPTPVDPLASLHSDTEEQIERLLVRVEENWKVTGVLHGSPRALVRRVEEELPLDAPNRLLRADRTPRELESVIFGVAAIVLIFLGAGLYGARNSAKAVEAVENV